VTTIFYIKAMNTRRSVLSESRTVTDTKKVKPNVIYVEVPESDDDETEETEDSYESDDSSEVDEEFDPTKQVSVDIHVYHHNAKNN
jgi:hypothetical protein